MSRPSHKLVRDNIPDIIKANGETPITRVLGPEEYLRALTDKLFEECVEFKSDLSLAELADVQEVVLSLADAIASREELEATRIAKAEQNGGFSQRIFLEGVE